MVEREAIGGQAGSSSRIRNYLGFARGISGAELAQRAYQQAWVFGTTFLLMREVKALRTGDGRHVLSISGGMDAETSSVVLAGGVTYRRLGIEELDELTGSGVFYGASPTDGQQFAGGRVFVVGGGNSAGQAAVHLSRYAAEVTLVVRGTDARGEHVGVPRARGRVTTERRRAALDLRRRGEMATGGWSGSTSTRRGTSRPSRPTRSSSSSEQSRARAGSRPRSAATSTGSS